VRAERRFAPRAHRESEAICGEIGRHDVAQARRSAEAEERSGFLDPVVRTGSQRCPLPFDKAWARLAEKRVGGDPERSALVVVHHEHRALHAKRAQRSADFMVIARTDARGVDGFEAAVDRARQYIAAGADWIFPEALATRDEFQAFANAIDRPLVANMTEFGKGPLLDFDELAAMGYRVVLYPVTLLRVAMKAMESTLTLLAADGTQRDLLDLMQTREELYDLLGYNTGDVTMRHER
jgi:2-methylisocitrate lyase-like PEP mutase family enzyme